MTPLCQDPIQAAQELLTACEPFAGILFPPNAPDDGYQLVADLRIRAGEVLALRRARARLTLALDVHRRMNGGPP